MRTVIHIILREKKFTVGKMVILFMSAKLPNALFLLVFFNAKII